MAIRGLTGKVQTVLGVIDSKDLGITLSHEHFLADFSVRFVEPAEASGKLLARLPPTMSAFFPVIANFGTVTPAPFRCVFIL